MGRPRSPGGRTCTSRWSLSTLVAADHHLQGIPAPGPVPDAFVAAYLIKRRYRICTCISFAISTTAALASVAVMNTPAQFIILATDGKWEIFPFVASGYNDRCCGLSNSPALRHHRHLRLPMPARYRIWKWRRASMVDELGAAFASLLVGCLLKGRH